jgi:hypothetical protein
MRSLIRPALFMVARIGLVLSVVAWIVGQWTLIAANSHSGRAGGFTVLLMDEGVVVALGNPSVSKLTFEPHVIVYGNTADDSWFRLLFAPLDELRDKSPAVMYLNRVPGMTLVLFPSTAAIIAIRHWLIITFFALFYGVLKWLYRKRGEAVEDE